MLAADNRDDVTNDMTLSGAGVTRREFVRVVSFVVGAVTLGTTGCGGGGEMAGSRRPTR